MKKNALNKISHRNKHSDIRIRYNVDKAGAFIGINAIGESMEELLYTLYIALKKVRVR